MFIGTGIPTVICCKRKEIKPDQLQLINVILHLAKKEHLKTPSSQYFLNKMKLVIEKTKLCR